MLLRLCLRIWNLMMLCLNINKEWNRTTQVGGSSILWSWRASSCPVLTYTQKPQCTKKRRPNDYLYLQATPTRPGLWYFHLIIYGTLFYYAWIKLFILIYNMHGYFKYCWITWQHYFYKGCGSWPYTVPTLIMKMLVWSCRRCGNEPIVIHLLFLIRIEKPDILFFSETKLALAHMSPIVKWSGYNNTM